jgi:predicted N-acetyltransferase YhbS
MSALPIEVAHLFRCPQHRPAVARLIHDEFWSDVEGASVEGMQARLTLADAADRVPLALVALHAGEPVGAVNLVERDNDLHPEWTPWLAGMVVAAPWRGRQVGSTLVRALLAETRRLGIERVYFGTDGPGFYTRLGARIVEQARPQFWFMRFDLS